MLKNLMGQLPFPPPFLFVCFDLTLSNFIADPTRLEGICCLGKAGAALQGFARETAVAVPRSRAESLQHDPVPLLTTSLL